MRVDKLILDFLAGKKQVQKSDILAAKTEHKRAAVWLLWTLQVGIPRQAFDWQRLFVGDESAVRAANETEIWVSSCLLNSGVRKS